jgi:hypothetical protein
LGSTKNLNVVPATLADPPWNTSESVAYISRQSSYFTEGHRAETVRSAVSQAASGGVIAVFWFQAVRSPEVVTEKNASHEFQAITYI